MATGKLNLARLLNELRTRYGDTVKVDDVAEVAESLLDTGDGGLSSFFRKMYDEIAALNQRIQSAKREIAALNPGDVKEQMLPSATNELDAIVEATANATNDIMNATEAIEGMVDSLDEEHRDALLDHTTRIYEACGFQDITGQRVTKVVNTLKEIEARVDALVLAFGGNLSESTLVPEGIAKPADDGADEGADEELLHGPQLAGGGISQEEIDRLLADMD